MNKNGDKVHPSLTLEIISKNYVILVFILTLQLDLIFYYIDIYLLLVLYSTFQILCCSKASVKFSILACSQASVLFCNCFSSNAKITK